MKLPSKTKIIYVLDPEELPIGAYCKMEETSYWDEDGGTLYGPEELRNDGIKPILNYNYFRQLKGQVGILRNVYADRAIMDDNGFMIKEDGTKEDPDYDVNNAVDQGCKYAIVFGNLSYQGYATAKEFVDDFILGKFTVYEKNK